MKHRCITQTKIIPTTSATSTGYIVGTRKIPSESLNQTLAAQDATSDSVSIVVLTLRS